MRLGFWESNEIFAYGGIAQLTAPDLIYEGDRVVGEVGEEQQLPIYGIRYDYSGRLFSIGLGYDRDVKFFDEGLDLSMSDIFSGEFSAPLFPHHQIRVSYMYDSQVEIEERFFDSMVSQELESAYVWGLGGPVSGGNPEDRYKILFKYKYSYQGSTNAEFSRHIPGLSLEVTL